MRWIGLLTSQHAADNRNVVFINVYAVERHKVGISSDLLLAPTSLQFNLLFVESSRLELFLENVEDKNFLVVIVADDGSVRYVQSHDFLTRHMITRSIDL